MDPVNKHDKPNRDKIFVSWSKDQSRTYAKVFFDWFTQYIDKSSIFFSERDIEGGQPWREQVLGGLKRTKVVIAFLTKEAVRHSRWMEAEATSVRFCGEDILFFPLLIDLGRDEIPHDSGWKTIHGDLTFGSHEEPSYIIGMVKQIMQVLQPSALNDPDFNSNLAGKVRLLMDEWSKWKVLYPSPSLQFRGPVSVINAFKNDSEFADWAYEYHRVVHHARDLVVHILDRYSHMDDPEQSLQEILPPPELLPIPGSPSVMNLYRDPIGKMIRLLEIVFRRLVEGSGATVWVCLRDLRGDGNYHNFLRSESFPGADSRDEASTPWPLTCKTITTLLRTTAPCNPPDMENTSGQNCTIITDPRKDTWPPYLLHSASSLFLELYCSRRWRETFPNGSPYRRGCGGFYVSIATNLVFSPRHTSGYCKAAMMLSQL
jgi:hypothetical protein